jgi:hypothetical protein
VAFAAQVSVGAAKPCSVDGHLSRLSGVIARVLAAASMIAVACDVKLDLSMRIESRGDHA